MADFEIFDHNKTIIETISLDDSVFQTAVNDVFLHQVLVGYEANKRQGTHQTKDRSMINGSSKKAYRQKGTGRARMGEVGVAHHRGGATQFGPHPRSYRHRITRSMRQESFRQCLSHKVHNEQLFILSDLKFSEPKTKLAAGLLDAFNVEGRVLFVDKELSGNAALSIRNLHDVEFEQTGSCSPLDIFKADFVFLTKSAAEELQNRYAKPEVKSNAA